MSLARPACAPFPPRPAVFVLDIFHPDAVLSLLEHSSTIDIILRDDPRRERWHEEADAILVRSAVKLSAADFTSARRLQLVMKQGVGLDSIDLDAARAAGVAVYNTPTVNSEAVAELVLATVLSLARRVAESDRKLRSGEKVVRSTLLGKSLYRKKIGIVGMGNIGQVVAHKFIGACQASIVAYHPRTPAACWAKVPHTRVGSLEELLGESDVVSLHVPLNHSTKDLIGERELALMKNSAILVNTSRGGIVDEAALAKVLASGRLWGAALDVVEAEPPTRDACEALLECDNVIITPHIGSGTEENQVNSGLAVVETLLAVITDEDRLTGKVI